MGTVWCVRLCVFDTNDLRPASLWVLQELLMTQMAHLVKHMVCACVRACVRHLAGLDRQTTSVLPVLSVAEARFESISLILSKLTLCFVLKTEENYVFMLVPTL
jgi:hypothetical protein